MNGWLVTITDVHGNVIEMELPPEFSNAQAIANAVMRYSNHADADIASIEIQKMGGGGVQFVSSKG
ncbi:MAG: hypothetical protein H6684_01195 [Deltaproteobacteria bacterium]|nr:hypothetical protein [Deltaproteobacteria bacterium]